MRNTQDAIASNPHIITPVQIHGHDFACIAVLSGVSSPCNTTGSEEKVIRVLEAPRAFEDTLALGAGDLPHASTEGSNNGTYKQVCNPHHCWCEPAHRVLACNKPVQRTKMDTNRASIEFPASLCVCNRFASCYFSIGRPLHCAC